MRLSNDTIRFITWIMLACVLFMLVKAIFTSDNERQYNGGHCILDDSDYTYVGNYTENDGITWYQYKCQCGHIRCFDERMD